MVVVFLLLIILLTFLLTVISKVLRLLGKSKIKGLMTLEKNNAYLWFITILIVGLIGNKFFNICLPKGRLDISIKDIVLIFIAMIPFSILSGYSPGRNIQGVVVFCLVFPIGEEILFRGIILSMVGYIMGGNIIYVPIPLLKGVTVQVLISAFCFGITHFQYTDFKINSLSVRKVLFAFIFGLFAGNLVEITRSILYTVIFHIFANSGVTIFSNATNRKDTGLTN